METNSNNIVDIQYEQTGTSSSTNELGMREMQARAYEARNQRFLLIKAPPASGKSRALMFIALDKLAHQGIKKVVVAVPEKSIGRSFNDTNLKEHGFFADWKIAPYFNLCDTSNEKDKADRFREFFTDSKAKILLCAHATLRNASSQLPDDTFNDCLLAIDEFHHTSADANSGLGGHRTPCNEPYKRTHYRHDRLLFQRGWCACASLGRRSTVLPRNLQLLSATERLYISEESDSRLSFYHGVYLDHLSEVLDTRKKTIIHIPV
mgnify:CR=1 FL=1